MANHRQAIKRHRQSLVRRDRNRHYTAMMKTAVKKLRTAIDNNESAETLQSLYRSVSSTIDRVASKGIIKSRTASRKNSRLAKAVAQAAAAPKKSTTTEKKASKAGARKATAKKTTKKSAAKSRK